MGDRDTQAISVGSGDSATGDGKERLPDAKTLTISWPTLLAYAAPPLVLFALSSELFRRYGQTARHGWLELAYDGRLETAARVRTVAMWLVLLALAIGALAFCWSEIRKFDYLSRTRLLLAWAGVATSLVICVWSSSFQGRAEHVLGRMTICRALSSGTEAGAPTRISLTAESVPEKGASGVPEVHRCIPSEQFRWLQGLNSAQLYLSLLFIPAVLFGAVSCAGVAPGGSEEQSARLEAFTFLASALLVAALLFLSALLHWPASQLKDTSAKVFNAQAGSFLLYWGVTYSALIAAFYVPIGLRIAGRIGAGGAAGTLKPLKALTTAATVFAPVITALIGDIVKI